MPSSSPPRRALPAARLLAPRRPARPGRRCPVPRGRELRAVPRLAHDARELGRRRRDTDLRRPLAVGVKCLRVFPLWPLLRPRPDTVDVTRLDRLAALLDMAHRHGLVVQVAPLTG